MLLDRMRATVRLAQGLRTLARYRPAGRTTMADRLEARAARHPHRPFLFYSERRMSWGQMNAAASRVAHWALAQGLGRGDVVALLMENRPEYLSVWMGLAKLGVVTALINTNLAGRALDHALRTAGAGHLVVGSELLDAFASLDAELAQELGVWVDPDPEGPADVALPAGAKDLAAALADAPDVNPDARLRREMRTGDPLFYIYTSGTTGNPKAARFSHLRFLSAGDGFAWAAGTGPGDVEYVALPLYHSAGGVVAVGRVLAGGGSLALRRRFSASQFWDDVRRYRATSFQYIGEFCRYLLAQPPRPDDADNPIRVATGNGLRPDIWREFQERFAIPRIIEFYGATEGNTVMINLDGKVGAVGYYPFKALSNARIIRYDLETDSHPRSADGFCIECRPGEPGEMIGRISRADWMGAGRFEGYTSQEDTERKILRDVFSKGDAWFRTGDLLYEDAEGYYYFVDRTGDTYRWKGENVSTQEVAEILSGFPGLDMISVYGVQVEGHGGRAGMMAFVPREDAAFDGKAFYAFTEQALPRYAAPLFVRVLREAQVTGTFKLRKVELQREGYDPGAIGDPLFVRDDAAKAYVRLGPEILAAIRDGRQRI